jgi:hypothetical protein
MRLLPVIASLTAVAALTVLAVGPVRAEGVGPCISAANQGYHDCKGGCRESFQLTKDTCANRDHVCVESCRADRQTCSQPILNTFNTALAASAVLREQDVANCRVLYGDGTPERDTCIDNAQVAAFSRRDAAREAAHPGLAQCRRDFSACVHTNCPPLSIPDRAGVRACKADASDVYDVCLADCQEARQLAKDTCRDRDHLCVEGCRATRDLCWAPFVTLRDAAIALCKVTRDGAIEGCPAPGQAGRDTCVDQAQVVAFQCRDAAREAVRGNLHACGTAFATCAEGCGPAGG